MVDKVGTVTGLFCYPIKSCAGTSLAAAEIVERGIANDRQWMIVDAKKKGLTQRDFAQMALIETVIDKDNNLHLSAPGVAPHVVSPRHATGESPLVDIWGTECAGTDEGNDVASWLGAYLGTECRLMRVAEDNERLSSKKLPSGEPVKLTFVDSCPFLVISQESLDDLNSRLEQPIPMDRFRPSVVISGLGPYAEDTLETIQISGHTLYKAKPCIRCVLVTIDQKTAEQGVEPMKTLSTYRLADNKVKFGVYFLHKSTGRISLGADVRAY